MFTGVLTKPLSRSRSQEILESAAQGVKAFQENRKVGSSNPTGRLARRKNPALLLLLGL